ncbi:MULTISPECIES: type II secretion system protein M [Salinivibrio]|uniref:type II secretion system protein M n=1 Tax=Salinivibrio TaxID=51366 RepID=UPI0009891324|nr:MULTISPECIES: type II secretion system protein M [Salinivibrio]
MMSQLKARWQSLSEREQRLLMVAALVMLLSVLYWGIIAPIQAEANNARAALTSERRLLSDVQQKHQQIVQLRAQSGASSRAPTSSNQPLNQVVAASAGEFSVTITRLQPGEASVQLGVEPLPFNQLLRWLDQLARLHGIQVVRLDTEMTDNAGVVKVNRLQLER